MRLNKKEVEVIKKIVSQNFTQPTIYLFGSRLDDSKKGGDIDLYVISKDKKDLLQKKIKAISQLERLLLKPIDIVVHRDFSKTVEKEALRGEIL